MRISVVVLAAGLLAQSIAWGQEATTVIASFDFEEQADESGGRYRGQAVDLRYESGQMGKAAVFNGRSSQLQVAAEPLWTFNRRESFGVDFWLKTEQRPDAIATVVTARNPGETPNWSFVLAGRRPTRGRIPGHISFELWTWDSQRVNSLSPVNDGRWHRIQAYFDRDTNTAVLLVDGAIQGAMTVESNYTGAPARLMFGNNVGDHQPYAGLLDTFRFVRGAPQAVRNYAAIREKTEKLPRSTVEANYDAWLERMMAPRPPQAESAEEWKRRRPEVRRLVLEALGLAPFPYTRETPGDLLPLDAQLGGKRDFDGFSVQGVAWQTWQGVYARGLLYLPTRGAGPYPAVLHPHGHFALGIAAPEVQRRAIMLARLGFIGLTVQSVHPEDLPWGLSPLSGMMWNNLRALDYLCARPDVDGGRLGCTGASGGGQQTLYLMALDDRLAAAVPAVYTSYSKEIMAQRDWVHCNCNWTAGLLRVTDEPEMAAVFAPKPVLYISTTQDWTATFPERGLPEIARVYAWHGAEEKLESVLYQQPHGYHQPWRERMYAFFAAQFRPGVDLELGEPERLPELSRDEVSALLPAVPTVADRPEALAEEFAARLGRKLAQPADRQEAERLQHNLRARLRRFLDQPVPPRQAAPPSEVYEDLNADYRLRLLHFSTEPEIRVPALLLTPLGAGPRLPLVILADARGKSVAFTEEAQLWKQLLAKGAGVLIPDMRYWGELSTGQAWTRAYGSYLGRSPAALAAHDLLEIARSLRSSGEFHRDRIAVIGIGDAAVPALLAGALDESLAGVAGSDVGFTYSEGRSTPILTGILQVADLDDLACLVAPRPFLWAGVRDEGRYANADRFAAQLAARSHLTTEERESAERPGLLAWYSTLWQAR